MNLPIETVVELLMRNASPYISGVLTVRVLDSLISEELVDELRSKVREYLLTLVPKPVPEARYHADYRDCLSLAAQIAESIEASDGSWCYEGDDLPGQILPHLKPLVGELEHLRSVVNQPVPKPVLLSECEEGKPYVASGMNGWLSVVARSGEYACDVMLSGRLSPTLLPAPDFQVIQPVEVQ